MERKSCAIFSHARQLCHLHDSRPCVRRTQITTFVVCGLNVLLASGESVCASVCVCVWAFFWRSYERFSVARRAHASWIITMKRECAFLSSGGVASSKHRSSFSLGRPAACSELSQINQRHQRPGRYDDGQARRMMSTQSNFGASRRVCEWLRVRQLLSEGSALAAWLTANNNELPASWRRHLGRAAWLTT